MTANERLAVAGLLDAYDGAVKSGDLNSINQVLRQVGLRRDKDGMNWTVANDA
jgi:hypothetical protein